MQTMEVVGVIDGLLDGVAILISALQQERLVGYFVGVDNYFLLKTQTF